MRDHTVDYCISKLTCRPECCNGKLRVSVLLGAQGLPWARVCVGRRCHQADPSIRATPEDKVRQYFDHIDFLIHTGCGQGRIMPGRQMAQPETVSRSLYILSWAHTLGFFGQTEEPLFKFPVERIVPCELHACMRVTDRLEAALIKVLCSHSHVFLSHPAPGQHMTLQEILAISDKNLREERMDAFITAG